MENNVPLATKKVCSIVRAVLFMLRKGMSKKKLTVDLNMMLKRGKIVSKAIGNLMFHHHHHNTVGACATAAATSTACPVGPLEYEFSCSNSPASGAHHHSNFHHFFPSFNLGKHRKTTGGLNSLFGCAHLPPTHDDEPNPLQLEQAVLEFLNSSQVDMTPVVKASPMLPGFGRTPLVRQLRITDSPFPLKNEDEDSYVDKAAEEFIERFYKDLRRQ